MLDESMVPKRVVTRRARPRKSRVSPDSVVRIVSSETGTVTRVLPRKHSPHAELARAAREARMLSALSVLALAERRITESELAELERCIEDAAEPRPVCESLDFLRRFWSIVVRAAHNPALEVQVARWIALSSSMEARRGTGLQTDWRVLRREPYRHLVRVLRRGSGAPSFWQETLEDGRLLG